MAGPHRPSVTQLGIPDPRPAPLREAHPECNAPLGGANCPPRWSEIIMAGRWLTTSSPKGEWSGKKKITEFSHNPFRASHQHASGQPTAIAKTTTTTTTNLIGHIQRQEGTTFTAAASTTSRIRRQNEATLVSSSSSDGQSSSCRHGPLQHQQHQRRRAGHEEDQNVLHCWNQC